MFALVRLVKRPLAPVFHDDLVKDHTRHGIGGIAQDDARAQQGAVDKDAAKCNIVERDTTLGGALLRNGIVQWALRSQCRAGLVLLLRADPNGPPQGARHVDVFIQYGIDDR